MLSSHGCWTHSLLNTSSACVIHLIKQAKKQQQRTSNIYKKTDDRAIHLNRHLEIDISMSPYYVDHICHFGTLNFLCHI